jgi:hypothetical protein
MSHETNQTCPAEMDDYQFDGIFLYVDMILEHSYYMGFDILLAIIYSLENRIR